MVSSRYKFILCVVVIVSALTAILASPVFNSKSIIIEGADRITPDFVQKTLGIGERTNLFSFNSSKAVKELKKNQYIDNVHIRKNYVEKTLHIDIEERILSCYIELMSGKYLYLDQEGRVLQVNSYYTENLPFIVGLDFTSFTVGKYLDVKNKESFQQVVILAQLLRQYDMMDDIVKFDVRDEQCPRLLIQDVEVALGDMRDIDEKIRTLKVVLENLPDKNMKGFLDMKDLSKPPRFTILT